MKIEKLEIRNFGKMQNRTLEFSDGIQLISGENESGKSTVHTFIRSMLQMHRKNSPTPVRLLAYAYAVVKSEHVCFAMRSVKAFRGNRSLQTVCGCIRSSDPFYITVFWPRCQVQPPHDSSIGGSHAV